MSKRYQLLAVIALAASFAGCNCCGTGGGGYPFVAGTRIAPPATGSVQIPNTAVANLPAPYYGQGAPAATQAPAITTQPTGLPGQGWRPAGNVAAVPAGSLANYNPTSQNVQNTAPNMIPANNLQVATSTSTISSTPGNQVARTTTTPQNTSTSTSVTGGMPLTDATQVAGNAPPSNTPRTAWEYVVRPNGTPVPRQYSTQPVLANTSNVATGSTSPQAYGTPRPGSYSYPNNAYPNNGAYGYPGNYPANVAQGWRQRTATPVPR